MTAPVPATEISLLISRVNVLGQQARYDMLEMARCEREAKRLFEIPQFSADAASILGMLASIRDDLAALTNWHELAIQISGGSALSYDHYATSLIGVFEYERAFSISKKAFELSRAKSSLDLMIRAASAIGDDNSVLVCLTEWKRSFNEDYEDIEIWDDADIAEALNNYSDDISSRENFVSEKDFDISAMRELVNEIRNAK